MILSSNFERAARAALQLQHSHPSSFASLCHQPHGFYAIQMVHVAAAACNPCQFDRFGFSRGDMARADKDGFTPLFYAVFYNNSRLIAHLVAMGADVNAVDSLGETALFTALRKDFAACIGQLLAHGAVASAVSRDGKSVWNIIAEKQRLDYVAAIASLPAERRYPNVTTANPLSAYVAMWRAGMDEDKSILGVMYPNRRQQVRRTRGGGRADALRSALRTWRRSARRG
jgi:hypothetical protein